MTDTSNRKTSSESAAAGAVSLWKSYRTRDGREVRLLMVDGGTREPVIGAVNEDDQWTMRRWDKDGSWCGIGGTPLDLIEQKPRIKREGWVNVYPAAGSAKCLFEVIHVSKEVADNSALPMRLACIRIEIDCQEGDGL